MYVPYNDNRCHDIVGLLYRCYSRMLDEAQRFCAPVPGQIGISVETSGRTLLLQYRYRGAVLVGVILESSRATQNVLGGTPKSWYHGVIRGSGLGEAAEISVFENATP